MAFLSRALKNAEVFLEQFDDRVAEASRRMALETAASSATSIEYSVSNSNKSRRRPRNSDPVAFDPSVLVREGETVREQLQRVNDEIEEQKSTRVALAKALTQATTILGDLEASLKFRTKESRDLRDALDRERIRAQEADTRATKEATTTQSKLESLRKEAAKENAKIGQQVQEQKQQIVELTQENEEALQRLQDQRKLDSESADQARQEALKALIALEEEVSAHNSSRHLIKVRQEALETSAVDATTALARTERRANEARVEAVSVLEGAREVEWKVAKKKESRDGAKKAVAELERELMELEESRDQKSTAIALEKLHERVDGISSSIEKRNMEIQRLEGEMASIEEAKKRAIGERPNSTSIGEVQTQLTEMAAATSRKEATLDLLRGENKTLLHQLLSERKRNREVQVLAAGRTQGPGWDEPMERGELGSAAAFWRSGDGATTKLRIPRNLGWWPAAQTALVSLDRMSVVLVAVLRNEAPLRLGIMSYVAVLHIVLYLLLHFGWWVGEEVDQEPVLKQGPPGLAGLGQRT